MESLLTISSTTYSLLGILFTVITAILVDLWWKNRCEKGCEKSVVIEDSLIEPPGPRSWPIIGSLHLLGGYEVPYQAFDSLAKHYGKIFKMDLGSVSCIVVNGLENIREVLMSKSTHFDGRPNFRRYQQLFSGNKENSLAFCDWSNIQKTRREMLRSHTFPRAFTSRYHQLDTFINNELNQLKDIISENATQAVPIKPVLLQACANVFTSYFCSKRFDTHDHTFNKMIRNFDEIFYEVNQGYAADFIPWLLPLHSRHLSKLAQWSQEIRDFMLNCIVNTRLENWTEEKEQEDYIDALIAHARSKDQPAMPWETALFALEDIIGGHSAVGNFIVKALAFIATRPDVQHKVQEEVDLATMASRDVSLADCPVMPYTEALILEVIRLIASPIVPHVATQDSSIAGFRVKKDTLIFLNNHDLSMSTTYWKNPEAFQPERFLNSEGRLVKPDHFLPFGGGRRTCMGYKMVQLISFSTIASLLQTYNIRPADNVSYKIPIGNLALPYDTFNFRFEKR